MSTTLEKMQRKFAPHHVPRSLAELCKYWDKHPVFFSGSFEVDADQYDAVRDWFQGHEAGWSRVKIFGVDGIHSLYGIWLYDGRKSDNAPIVYLGGEGEGTTVMASAWQEFLSILASNREWGPFDKKFYAEEKSTRKENERFRKWLQEKFSILPPKDPMAIMKKAKKNIRILMRGWPVLFRGGVARI